ncbi:MAG: hypothetical protein ACOX1F_01845 [Erysipelotrichaceae bacterium]
MIYYLRLWMLEDNPIDAETTVKMLRYLLTHDLKDIFEYDSK